ncbi:MAG: homoserine kinase [Burkholderiales bacterium]
MSVYTVVTPEELAAWLRNYSLGTLVELKGIAAGIENTNYFVTTTHGRYVLTLFEILQAHELPFYMNLMAHLARHGIPCPQPIANFKNENLSELNGKPASIFTCVPGVHLGETDAGHCAIIGELLAEMHLAGQSFAATMPNPRGPLWWTAATRRVAPFIDAGAGALLRAEIAYQAQHRQDDLPRGAIHADLFRDNVLWDGPRVGGVIDFYFACTDALLYDVAITVNDWCFAASPALDAGRTRALLAAYHRVRPLTAAEIAAWPVMLRAGALRFWVSRLYDLHLPRPGALVHAKDPAYFQRMLEQHVAQAAGLAPMLA